MLRESLETVPLEGPFGLEVRGLDLRDELEPDLAGLLRVLFDEHHLLLFRDGDLGPDDQVRLCRSLRPVADPVAWISNVEPGFHPERALLFHSDYAFTDTPMLGLSLYAVEVSERAAPTRFASNVRGLRTMPAALRERLIGVEIVHAIDTVSGRDDVRVRLDDLGAREGPSDLYPRATRPALWEHPVTGQELVFVVEQQASHVSGRSCRDSDELLEAVFAHVFDSANVYEHEWRVGDLVLWDNLALQHGRRANPTTVRRSLRRVAMHEVTTAQLIAGTGFDPVRRAELARGGR